MRISDFDYTLPHHNIALYPPQKRGTSRLLVLNRHNGMIAHRHYKDLIDYTKPGDVIVLNNTKVIKARLLAHNHQGQLRELLLLETHKEDLNNMSRQALYRGKLHEGELLKLHNATIRIDHIFENGIVALSSQSDLLKLAELYGNVPLPPYLKREADTKDTKRYQTEFAQKLGSVAAPTASLNFTKELRQKLLDKGVNIVELTLHVGMGTFLPIRTEEVNEHVMHGEYFEIPPQTVSAILSAKRKGQSVIAIGTTVARTLEYALQDISALSRKPVNEQVLSGEADIFIYPGYTFKVIDKLLTNFHAPRTTVLMLTAAFAEWHNLKHAYEEAVIKGYEFLSYGDSMFVD